MREGSAAFSASSRLPEATRVRKKRISTDVRWFCHESNWMRFSAHTMGKPTTEQKVREYNRGQKAANEVSSEL